MEKQIALSLLQLGLVALLALLFFKPRQLTKRLLVLGSGAFLFSRALSTIPMHHPSFNLTGEGWNWSGKIYAILGSCLLYFTFRKDFRSNDFIAFQQKPESLKANLWLLLALLLLNFFSAWSTHHKQPFNGEALAYQLTLPGLEEELLFRGLLLSLLATIYRKPIVVKGWGLGYASVWLTALLFGLVHGLGLGKDWSLNMNWPYFAGTFLPGWLLGWMTLRSRSILLAILTHNLSNFSLVLTSMLL